MWKDSLHLWSHDGILLRPRKKLSHELESSKTFIGGDNNHNPGSHAPMYIYVCVGGGVCLSTCVQDT